VIIPAALRASAAHVFVDSLEQPVLAAVDVHHLRRVLRLRSSDVVSASDGAGRWCVGRLGDDVFRDDVFEVDGPITIEPASTRVTIATAVPKGDRAEWMVQKLTELGVGRILFVDCARSVVRWNGERAGKQLARLRRVAREAAMQSRQVWLPVVDGPIPFAAAVSGEGVALADPASGGRAVADDGHRTRGRADRRGARLRCTAGRAVGAHPPCRDGCRGGRGARRSARSHRCSTDPPRVTVGEIRSGNVTERCD
jgi:RNA methyltransferase